MITKQAVRDFLRKPRDDWSWYGKLTDDELDRRRDRLPVDPPIWNRLLRHQKQGVLLGIRLKKVAYWYATGTGKTLMMLALARYFDAKGTLDRVLVLVPNLVNKQEWADEINKHCGTRIPYIVLDGSMEERWKTLQTTDAVLILETYTGLTRLLSNKQPAPKPKARFVNGRWQRGKDTKKNVLAPNAERIAELSKLCNMVVLDESGAVGNQASLTYRIVKKLVWAADYGYELNGTPFGRDPTPLWGQMNCLDRGDTLGESLGLFRAAFFHEVSNGFGTEYKFINKMSDDLHQLLKNRSLRCQADEADLPQTVRIRKLINLGHDASIVYKKARDSLRKARGQVTATKNEFLRMRQISSGFLGYADDETGKRAEFEFADNPKLEMLLDIVSSVQEAYKVVVFNEFTFSGSMICRELAKLKINHARIYGGTKNPEAELSRFKNDDECRVLVLQSAAGGMGLNLQIAKYCIYFESPVSPRLRQQTEARVVRQGSEHGKVYVYDLVARGVDFGILEFHREGKDLLEAILNGSGAELL